MIKIKKYILLILIALSIPNSSFAFPTFNKNDDMLKFLFSFSEGAILKLFPSLGSPTPLKLSDGKTYILKQTTQDFTFVFGLPLVYYIFSTTDSKNRTNLKNFKKLVRFHFNLYANEKMVNLKSIKEFVALYDSTLFASNPAENVKASIDFGLANLYRQRKETPLIDIFYKQLLDILRLQNSGDTDVGAHYINKIGGSEGTQQKYVFKIRATEPIAFTLTRIHNP